MTQRKATPVVIPINVEPGQYREPTLEEILSDSIVTAVMRADRVDADELRALLDNVAQTRRDGSGATGLKREFAETPSGSCACAGRRRL